MTSSAIIDRRTLLLAGGATLLAVGSSSDTAAASTNDLDPLLETFADEILQLEPGNATSLGVDNGHRAALRAQLSDLSDAGRARWAAQVASMRQRLGRIDRARLSDAAKLRYDTVVYAADRGSDCTRFDYGGGAANGFFGGAEPYVVTQQHGAITSVPEFLVSQHPIKTAADAEAALARVRAMARQIDEETRHLADNAAIGVMPPDFIAATALGQLRGFRATPAASQRLVASIADRAAKTGIAGDWAARCTALIEREVYPALDRQIDGFAKSTASAPHVAGVERLPGGEAYYRLALRLGTTTTLSPAEIHRTGLEQNRLLQAQMDTLLKGQGMTQGSVGARLQALNSDPRFLFPNDDAGRAALIAYCNGRLAALRPLLPKMSDLGLKADVVVNRVPADIEAGAALGYMNPAALDGSRPAIYYINLKSTELWPKYQLSTLTAHEGVPGHAFQFAYLAETADKPPLITSLTAFNAFVEGWALYAEQLVDELGLYADDPFGRLGYLQAQQFRACRLVVDTGIHAMRWTREQSVRFLTEETGRGPKAMTSETDRYCVSPGQACGYKVGHNEILRLRAKAQGALGAKFDLRSFDDAIVETGGVPLTVLASAIDTYVAKARG